MPHSGWTGETHEQNHPHPARRHDVREGGASPCEKKNVFVCACMFNYTLLACEPNYLIVSYSIHVVLTQNRFCALILAPRVFVSK